MRLQEFIPDCLGNEDFAVETSENFDASDLNERRDGRGVADNDHLDVLWPSWLMSSCASFSV